MSMGRDGSLKQTTPSPLQIAMPIWQILTGTRLLTAHSNLGSQAVTRASRILRIDRLDDRYGSAAWMHTRGVGDGMDAYSRFSRWCRCARLGATAGREVGAADGASVGVAATASSGRVATTGAAGSGGSTVGSSR